MGMQGRSMRGGWFVYGGVALSSDAAASPSSYPPAALHALLPVLFICWRPHAPCRRSCCLAPALHPRLRAAAGWAGAAEAAGVRAIGCALFVVVARDDGSTAHVNAAALEIPLLAPAKSPAK